MLCGYIDANAVSLTCQITYIVLDVTFRQKAGIHINLSSHWEPFITMHFWNTFKKW